MVGCGAPTLSVSASGFISGGGDSAASDVFTGADAETLEIIGNFLIALFPDCAELPENAS